MPSTCIYYNGETTCSTTFTGVDVASPNSGAAGTGNLLTSGTVLTGQTSNALVLNPGSTNSQLVVDKICPHVGDCIVVDQLSRHIKEANVQTTIDLGSLAFSLVLFGFSALIFACAYRIFHGGIAGLFNDKPAPASTKAVGKRK